VSGEFRRPASFMFTPMDLPGRWPVIASIYLTGN